MKPASISLHDLRGGGGSGGCADGGVFAAGGAATACGFTGALRKYYRLRSCSAAPRQPLAVSQELSPPEERPASRPPGRPPPRRPDAATRAIRLDPREQVVDRLRRQPPGRPQSRNWRSIRLEVVQLVGQLVVEFLSAPLAAWPGEGRPPPAEDTDCRGFPLWFRPAEDQCQQQPDPVSDHRDRAEHDGQDDENNGVVLARLSPRDHLPAAAVLPDGQRRPL